MIYTKGDRLMETCVDVKARNEFILPFIAVYDAAYLAVHKMLESITTEFNLELSDFGTCSVSTGTFLKDNTLDAPLYIVEYSYANEERDTISGEVYVLECYVGHGQKEYNVIYVA
jgi:hypothetical protein